MAVETEKIKPNFVTEESVQEKIELAEAIQEAQKKLYNKILNEVVQEFIQEHRDDLVKEAHQRVRQLREDKNDESPVQE
jgi:hypothetical protein